MNRNVCIAFILLIATFPISGMVAQESPRQIIGKAMTMDEGEEQLALVRSLAGQNDPAISELLTAWREGGVFIYEPTNDAGESTGPKVAIKLGEEKDAEDNQAAFLISSGAPLTDSEGKAMRISAYDAVTIDTYSELRQEMKTLLDTLALTDPDPEKRRRAVEQLGFEQDLTKLQVIDTLAKTEENPEVRRAIRFARSMIELKSPDSDTQIAACRMLGKVNALPAKDALGSLARDTESTNPPVAAAANEAVDDLETHLRWVNFYGTLFRGLSLGSVLLVVAIGLAITFGLMGVINMAHGELIAVGAYTTYVIQCIFGGGLTLSPFGLFTFSLPALHLTGADYQWYFIVAIPLSFLMAALVGVLLERGIIQFLYRRPLESLLATWGVSLVLQQVFRSVFGANNVQVESPSWLSGNWTAFDVIFGWNRIFVIGFAVAIIAGTWLILNKTPLGLLIRAVMQNRAMASCMGVRTERVNMMTFAFGSGLAGLAGAFLSQLGNVGPGMGQDRIVDAFMTVVVGGVGSIFGTVISALGIGVADQSLQQILGNPVLGKIIVLGAIILFLQWKPAGLFVTKSRSLES